MKSAKQMERHFKGAANHWRLQILLWVSEHDGVTVADLASDLKGQFRTISQHAQLLLKAGLLNKKYFGRNVQHSLSPYGESFVRFIKDFRKISDS